MTFEQKIKELRTERNMTQSELAEILGVHPTTINKYELGINKPRMKAFEKLSEIFGVSKSELIGEKQERTEADELAKIYAVLSSQERSVLMSTARALYSAHVPTSTPMIGQINNSGAIGQINNTGVIKEINN